MISATEINDVLGIQQTPVTLGITKIHNYIEKILSPDYHGSLDIANDTYIICIDNVYDNDNVKDMVSKIHQKVGRMPNFHVVNYICFEQLIIASLNDTAFFPNLVNDNRYNYLKKHAKAYGTGHSRKLEKMLNKNNIQFETTERIYNEVLEKAVTAVFQKIGKMNNDVLYHHYILKGKWSYCWTSDCTNDCPNDRCWEATGTRIMCKTCTSPLKNKSHSCCLVDDRYGKNINVQNPKPVKRYTMRKFAEVTTCNKNLPSKLEDRIKLLFGNIQEIVKIDNY